MLLLGVWLLGPGLVQPARGQAVTGTILSVGLGGNLSVPGVYRVGSYVPILVRLENRSGGRLACRLAVEQSDLDGDRVLSQSREIILEPSAQPRDVWLYYWPRPDDAGHGPRAVVVLDPEQRVLASIRSPLSADAQPGLQPVDNRHGRSYRWVLLLGKRPVGLDRFSGSVGGGGTVAKSWIDDVSMFPDQALGLDGVDLVIWEADSIRPSELPGEFQMTALLDWVQAGGHLVITLSDQGQELQTVSSRLNDALPAGISGSRSVDGSLIADFAPSAESSLTRPPPGPLRQLIAAPRSGARVLVPAIRAADAKTDAPLVISRPYGAGVVTLITTDISVPGVAQTLAADPGDQIISFWQKIAGWNGQVLTADEYKTQIANHPDDILDNPNSAGWGKRAGGAG
jgi:hypothetical protein